MAPQDILSKLRATPFRPFRVHISDGTSYDFVGAGFAGMSATELFVGIDPDHESGLPRRSIYIAPNHVTRIEPILTDKRP